MMSIVVAHTAAMTLRINSSILNGLGSKAGTWNR